MQGRLFEASVADIEFAAGQFRVVGTDRYIQLLPIDKMRGDFLSLRNDVIGLLADDRDRELHRTAGM